MTHEVAITLCKRGMRSGTAHEVHGTKKKLQLPEEIIIVFMGNLSSNFLSSRKDMLHIPSRRCGHNRGNKTSIFPYNSFQACLVRWVDPNQLQPEKGVPLGKAEGSTS